MSDLNKLVEDIDTSDEEILILFLKVIESADEYISDSDDDNSEIEESNNKKTNDKASVSKNDNKNDNKKRFLNVEADSDSKRSKQESDRKAKVNAIWAEMNQNSKTNKTQQQQPLDDISSSVNQTKDKNMKEKDVKENDNIKEKESDNKNEPSKVPVQIKNKIQRPKSNLSSLVSQYNIKTPKMNTLDKSRLDWQGYVDREGIKDDLKYKNKDGYMEKVAFLQRVDDRRLNDLKQGQKQSKR
ncbi:unnamed protein product [Cunninghamella blakesleeana]